MKTRFLARARANAKATGEIYIYDEISNWGVTASAVKSALDDLLAQGATELHLFINSPGGDVFEGVAIYNLLRRFAGKKTVHIDGLAASMASVIALAGDHIVCGSSAMVMIHDPWAFAMGSGAELREKADTLDKIADSMLATYVERTGQAAADVKRWMRDETWMTASEAKERGFVHEVADETKDDGEKALHSTRAFGLLDRFTKTPALLRALTTPPGDPRHEPDAARVTEIPMKTVLKALGLAENASEAEVLAALTARESKNHEVTAKLAEAIALTGKATVGEALGVIQGWKLAADKNVELQARIDKIEADARETKVKALVDDGVKSGQIPPAMKDFWLNNGRKDVSMLEAFLATAPKNAAVTTESKPPAGDQSVVVLSAEDKAVAKQMGVSEKDYAATKAKAAA